MHNPEIDLDDLDLKEEVEETNTVHEKVETVEKPDVISMAKESVIEIIGQNVFDRDLENSLMQVVNEHFDALTKNPPYHADIYRIPDLNQKIWDAYHNYETFVYENKFENINLNEISKILREQVVPKITRTLWDLTSQQAQSS
jgi:tRNA1(Val) A37 N6-methylase TrmN6